MPWAQRPRRRTVSPPAIGAVIASTGRLSARTAGALGFNVDFAPVLDLAFEASRSVMGSRAVSPDPLETVAYAREFLAGLGGREGAGMRQTFSRTWRGQTRQPSRTPGDRQIMKDLWARTCFPTDASPTTSPCDGFACGLSAGHEKQDAGVSLEAVDYRYSAQANRIQEFDRVGRSGDGRRAFRGKHRRCRREFVARAEIFASYAIAKTSLCRHTRS